MQQSIVKLNEIANNLGLQCIETGGTAQKLSFVGIKKSGSDFGFEFKLTLTWHGEVVIESFEGCTTAENFCEVLTKLSSEIKKLKL